MEKMQSSATAQKISFVAIASGKSNLKLLHKVLAKEKLSFPVLIDPTASLNNKFGDYPLLPATYLVTTKGTIVKQYLGHPKLKILERDVEKFL